MVVAAAPPWAAGFLERGPRCLLPHQPGSHFVEGEGFAASLCCLASLPQFPGLCLPPCPQVKPLQGLVARASGLPGSHFLGLHTRVLGAQGTIMGGGGGGVWENSGLDHRGLGTAWPSQGPRVLLFLTGLYLQPLLFFNLASPPFIPLLKQEPRVLLTCGCRPSSERCWPSDGATSLSSVLTISCLH